MTHDPTLAQTALPDVDSSGIVFVRRGVPDERYAQVGITFDGQIRFLIL